MRAIANMTVKEDVVNSKSDGTLAAININKVQPSRSQNEKEQPQEEKHVIYSKKFDRTQLVSKIKMKLPNLTSETSQFDTFHCGSSSNTSQNKTKVSSSLIKHRIDSSIHN